MTFLCCLPLLVGIASFLTTTSAWSGFSLASPRFDCSGNVATIETLFISDTPLLRLSVDWGEDPTWYNYDTVYANISSNKLDGIGGNYYYATNGEMEILTNLPEWNGVTSEMKSGYSANSSYIRIHHVYEEAGTFMPVSLVVGYVDSFSEWKIASCSCPYQLPSASQVYDSGSKGECETERTHFRIDKDGACTMSSSESFRKETSWGSHRMVSKSMVYFALMGIGGFVLCIALRAAWCRNRTTTPFVSLGY
jgi:hypothetical protein